MMTAAPPPFRAINGQLSAQTKMLPEVALMPEIAQLVTARRVSGSQRLPNTSLGHPLQTRAGCKRILKISTKLEIGSANPRDLATLY